MAEAASWKELLHPQDRQSTKAVGPVHVLAGVHALNQARSLTRVMEAVASGVAKLETDVPAMMMVVDAGSRDGTLEAARSAAQTLPPNLPVRCVRVAGPASRNRAVQAILGVANHVQASACLLVDAGLVGLSPEGIQRLVEPLFAGEAQYVAPAYTHAVSEGTLTSNLLAPMARALFGRRIQQLLGGCAGLSRSLIERLADAAAWEGDGTEHGAEISLAVESLASGGRIVEAHLGRKRMDPGLVSPDLSTTLAGTVGPLFHVMDRHHETWAPIRHSKPTPRVGDSPSILAETGEAQVERMVRAFKLGLKDLLPVWEQVMPEDTLGLLYPLGPLPTEEFRFQSGPWARVVYDFALAFHQRVLPRDQLLRALTPLYLGRVAAFLLEAQGRPPAELTILLDRIGQAFEDEKGYLTARWR